MTRNKNLKNNEKHILAQPFTVYGNLGLKPIKPCGRFRPKMSVVDQKFENLTLHQNIRIFQITGLVKQGTSGYGKHGLFTMKYGGVL